MRDARGHTPLPAGGLLAVERCLEGVSISSRGQRARIPLTNPRGLQSERVQVESVLNAGTTKRTPRRVPRLLIELPSPARGLPP